MRRFDTPVSTPLPRPRVAPREGEKLITLCLDRVTGKTLWRSETILAVNDLAEEVWATPAIGHRTIYIRTRTAVYAFGVTF